MRGIEQIPWFYDLGMAVLERTGLGRWRRWLVSAPGTGPLLDVGCGTGRSLALLHERSPVVGLDPCRAPLSAARRRAPRAWLVQGRAEQLPFQDAVFDVVISGLVFCSVDDPRAGLAEIRRVLRPDGSLRMLEHVRATTAWHAWLQDRVQPVWTRLTGGCRPNRDTERVVAESGFEVLPATRRASGTMRRFVARAGGGRNVPDRSLDRSPAAGGSGERW